LLDCIAAVTAVRVCRPGFGGGRGRGRGRGGADGEDGMATVAAVAGGGRWKHDMFEELVRREETGANPEVGCCANQAHCLCAVCVGGALWVVHVSSGRRWKHDMFEELVRREKTGANPEVHCFVFSCGTVWPHAVGQVVGGCMLWLHLVVMAVCCWLRTWKHKMFRELVRRKGTGFNPEVCSCSKLCASFCAGLWDGHVVCVGAACCWL
jgi:hypothetical protein